MKIAVAQLNPIVGDINGNLQKLKKVVDDIRPGKADLVIFPELFICGYPPRDLLKLPWFVDKLEKSVETLIEISSRRPDLGILVGTVRRSHLSSGNGLFNCAMLIDSGEVLFEQHKQLLPSYDVFDESRYFDSGKDFGIVDYKGSKLGISICEDAWNDPDFEKAPIYSHNPIEDLARQGSDLLINLSASPFHLGKGSERFTRYSHHAARWGIPMIYAAQVGANDDLIFDGCSMVIDKKGNLIKVLAAYEEDMQIIQTSLASGSEGYTPLPEMESLKQALVLGVRDYFEKCGFKSGFIGLSGGIDSALTTCIAVDALGSSNVIGVTMPSSFSSTGSVDDSVQLANNLKIRCDTIPITTIMQEYENSLRETFAGLQHDETEENIQARIRSNLLMAYSNKFGGLVLATGNKTEIAVGYCTLYGDLSGGLAVISDLPKMMVYRLARWYNRDGEIIPQSTIDKAPSAELRPDQKDLDTLPPYEILDEILEMFLENRMSKEEIIKSGFNDKTVEWVITTVNRNEYKRKQAPPGLRVTSRAFGTGWRMPVAAFKL